MEQGIPLMTSQEIKQVPDEDVIGFHRQLPPFMAKRMDWRHFPLLRERQAMSPPELVALPELAEPLPTLRPQSNGQLHDFINPDMTIQDRQSNAVVTIIGSSTAPHENSFRTIRIHNQIAQ
jgi:type IV secretory pathway TraG/TraD family ATPase VirD4